MQFRPKTDEELAWDLVKAAVTAQVNLEVAAYRMNRRNELLSELWPAFSASLSGEEILTIDPEHGNWIRDAVAQLEVRTGR